VGQAQKVVVQRVQHDETLGTVVGLSAVVEPSIHTHRHCGVEVIGARHDEGIAATQLKHDLLEVTARLFVDYRHMTRPGSVPQPFDP